jgi:putative ABC transport system permease protein
MIKTKDVLKLVNSYLSHNKLRSTLTISGIVIGVFVLVFFIFLSFGLKAGIYEQFSASGLNIIGVQLTENKKNGAPQGEGLTKIEISKIKSVVTDYKYIQGGIFYTSIVEYKGKQTTQIFLGYENWKEIRQDFSMPLEKGRHIKDNDKSSVVLGAKVVSNLNKETDIKLFENILINGKKYKVVGILKERGDLFVDGTAYMSQNEIKRLSKQDTFSLIRISYKDGVNINSEIEKLDIALNGRNINKKQKYSFQSPQKVIEQVSNIINILTFVISFVSFISLITGGINVLNTMNSNTNERIGQISTMKAIGATNKDILKLFLTESFFLGLIGSFLGFFLAYGFAKGIEIIISAIGYTLPILFNLNLMLLVVIITSIGTTIFGTYPALKAAKINPSENLKDD